MTARRPRWLASCRSSASDWARRRLGGVGVRERLGGEARVDHEQPQVVVAELVEAELREHEDAEDLVLEDHRREEHRLVEVVLGARDRVRPRVLRGVRQVLGDPVLGDPAGDALAELDLELLGRLVDVLADLALHRDRDQVVAVEAVDADVVVVDELAQLGRDRQPDLPVARQPARRAPSCWIDWSWAAQVAICS